jgi:hypothetical protein
MSQPTNLTKNQPANQPTKASHHLPTNQITHPPTNQFKRTNEQTKPPPNPTINQVIINQLNYQQTNPPTNSTKNDEMSVQIQTTNYNHPSSQQTKNQRNARTNNCCFLTFESFTEKLKTELNLGFGRMT